MSTNDEMHAFSKDFVFCLMKKWRPEWEINNPYYASRNSKTPFTENMKNKVIAMTEENRHEIQRSFEYEFPNANIYEHRFSDVCEKYRYNFVMACRRNQRCDIEELFLVFLKLSKFAGLAICFNIEQAPYIVVETVYRILDGLNDYDVMPENLWADMDQYCAS